MKGNLIIHCSMFVLFSASCSNTSPSDLSDSVPLPATVSYAQNVKPIIDANCISCHSSIPTNGAPNSLTDYAAVKQSILSSGLIIRINKQPGDLLLMPQGGPKLPQNKIDIIELWQMQGFNQ